MKLLHQRQIWGNTKATYLNPTMINKIQKEKKKKRICSQPTTSKRKSLHKNIKTSFNN